MYYQDLEKTLLSGRQRRAFKTLDKAETTRELSQSSQSRYTISSIDVKLTISSGNLSGQSCRTAHSEGMSD